MISPHPFSPGSAADVAKKEARQIYFRQLWKQVKQMPESDRLAMAAKRGIKTVQGHELSPCNQMLCILQHRSAVIVAGFRQWIEAGRCVRKGEHGMMIWIPTGKRKTDTPQDCQDEQNFIIGTMFDIGQTDEIRTNRTSIELSPSIVPSPEPIKVDWQTGKPLAPVAPVIVKQNENTERINPLEIAA